VSLNNGRAVFTATALAAGPHVITASYSGGGGYPAAQTSISQTVNGLATTLTLAPSATAAIFGQTIVLTATVGPATPPAGYAAPTGQVSFYLVGSVLAAPRTPLATVPLAAGGASFTLANLAVGSQNVG